MNYCICRCACDNLVDDIDTYCLVYSSTIQLSGTHGEPDEGLSAILPACPNGHPANGAPCVSYKCEKLRPVFTAAVKVFTAAVADQPPPDLSLYDGDFHLLSELSHLNPMLGGGEE